MVAASNPAIVATDRPAGAAAVVAAGTDKVGGAVAAATGKTVGVAIVATDRLAGAAAAATDKQVIADPNRTPILVIVRVAVKPSPMPR